MNKPNLNDLQFVEFMDNESSSKTAGYAFAEWKVSLIKNEGTIHSVASGVVGGISSEGYIQSLTYIHVFYFPFIPQPRQRKPRKA